MEKMKVLFFTLLLFNTLYLKAQVIIVTNQGDPIKAYNMEIGLSSIFYQLSERPDAEIKRIAKEDVLIIRKADGTNFYPNSEIKNTINLNIRTSVPVHEPITAYANTPIKKEKKGNTFYAKTFDGKELNYQILSEEEKTLSVIEGNYKQKEYIIPEYVILDGEKYTVTTIGKKAFFGGEIDDYSEMYSSKRNKINNIVFPLTLKAIESKAFQCALLTSIILPEGLEKIGEKAFYYCNKDNDKNPLIEIYLPSSVKEIGKDCFRGCGDKLSPREFCKGYFICMPSFINEDNCSFYGIDNSAVRNYKESFP